MPLLPQAAELLTNHLKRIEEGYKAGIITIGALTDVQHTEINRLRIATGFPISESPELVYLGRHHYASRLKDGYKIEQMVVQIEHGCCAAAVVRINRYMTALQNVGGRIDPEGQFIRDLAVLELTARKPRAEVFSVIPKGDTRK